MASFTYYEFSRGCYLLVLGLGWLRGRNHSDFYYCGVHGGFFERGGEGMSCLPLVGISVWMQVAGMGIRDGNVRG